MTSTNAPARPLRVIVAKAGLDGHDRGAKVIARALRDAGMEVIYTGLFQTPEQIVQTAIQEDADGIGLSILSGAHMTLFPLVVEQLKEQGADDVVFFGGGTIPQDDAAELRRLGVREIFTPGAPLSEIITFVERECGKRRELVGEEQGDGDGPNAAASRWCRYVVVMPAGGPRRVRTRVAPSPTGDPHVGTAYVALANYAFAKKHGGDFLLRIEDTDQARSTPESERAILAALRWTGLSWDEGPDVGGPHGPYRQSERSAIYKRYADELLANGHAFRCFCTPERLDAMRAAQRAAGTPQKYDGHCLAVPAEESGRRAASGEPFVVRMKVPQSGVCVVHDVARGEIPFEFATVDMQVLMKSDGLPTYHLANVVDDHLMEITHVIRAEEWISSTQKHVLLYRAFGWTMPEFIHMPLLRNADKSKISKRKHPTSINFYRDIGILPHALLNFLGLLGWSFGGDREKFTLDEMISVFSGDRLSLGGPVFDLAKLTWLNEKYLHELTYEQLADAAIDWRLNKSFLVKVLPLVRERIKKLDELIPAIEYF